MSHAQTSKQSSAPDYSIGDLVWLSTEHLSLPYPTHKLTQKFIGPYCISAVLPNAVTLTLPSSVSIHPTVNISCVKPYKASLDSQPIFKPDAITMTKDQHEEYKVDYII